VKHFSPHRRLLVAVGLASISCAHASVPYDEWTAAQFPGESNPAIIGPEADPDGDGIDNGIEFVIGGDPSGPGSGSYALLPTVAVDETFLSFSYRRTNEAAGDNPVVEYSTTLATGGWIEAEPGVDGVTISEENGFYGAGIDRVTVKIPKALAGPGGRIVARLRVDIPVGP
jgi:fibronectin-binding autotransporter adhesin